MNREDQVKICKSCTHKKMDLNLGLVCNLTNERATFIDKCSDYKSKESELASQELEKTNNEIIMNQIYSYAADLLINQRKPRQEVVRALSRLIDDETASIITAQVEKQIRITYNRNERIEAEILSEQRSSASKRMVLGTIIFLIGVTITVISYSIANPGGTYIIAGGAIITGVVIFIKGLIEH